VFHDQKVEKTGFETTKNFNQRSTKGGDFIKSNLKVFKDALAGDMKKYRLLTQLLTTRNQ
jgi:hypothetical protein